MKPLLDVRQLSVDFHTANGPLNAVNQIDMQIGRGEIVCLVGESGSGKTVTSKAMMRLTDYDNGEISHGEIELDGTTITSLSPKQLSELRGRRISMIFQEPMSALDPVFTIGSQITEVIMRHQRLSKTEANERAVELLRRVGIPEPEMRMKQHPFELSGGMRQRAMIAIALACGPQLLIADEPTTALDVTIQAQILHLLQELRTDLEMSILFITHDLGIAAQLADRIVVMYAGSVVEQAPAKELFARPLHPYTQGLLRSIVSFDTIRKSQLYTIRGSIPKLNALPEGCRFHPRCPHATAQCRTQAPPLRELLGGRVACWHAEELLSNKDAADAAAPSTTVTVADNKEAKQPERQEILLEVREVSKYFPVQKSWFARQRKFVHAVDGVSFHINKGETFGLVGESGCGKSTLGKLLLQLEKATSGEVLLEGENVLEFSTSQWKHTRRNMQAVFQDPYGSLNPRWKISDIVGEPLWVHDSLRGAAKREKVEQLLELVGLDPSWHDRYPHEFSGGQRQRIGIARAIALNPQFILADEAVSALDVSVQSQIVNLLQRLQDQLGLTYLFIAHGLNIVRHVSDRIGVMYLGKLVEIAPADELFLHPAHHYTRALLNSVPSVDPERRHVIEPIRGEMPSPSAPPPGCRFHTRCPAAQPRCSMEAPQLEQIGAGHYAACHYPL